LTGILILDIFSNMRKTIKKPNALILFALILWLFNCDKKNPVQGEKTFPVFLDKQGPYLILSSQAAGRDYAQAIELAKQLHPGAVVVQLDFSDASAVQIMLKKVQPFYAMIFIKPEELDVQLAWQWLYWSAAIDQDPFIDVRTGFVTGENPTVVFSLLKRTRDALTGKILLPATVVDQLGPNSQMAKHDFSKTPSSFMIPVLAQQFPIYTITHGLEGFSNERLQSLSGAGLVHFGGHGHPDRVDNCLNGPYVRRVPFSPCVVFSGACYTGVTGRWFDVSSGIFRSGSVPAQFSFCLGILANQAVAYLAALHADHGIPVYQEMEFLSYTGASLGDTIKHTQDGVIIASGAKSLPLIQVKDGTPVSWSATEFMLWGTASRVLFGDPALKIMNKFCDAPFDIRVQSQPEAIKITATIKNTALQSTFADTYFSDLSRTGQFNDRILISCPWPAPWLEIEDPIITKITALGKPLSYRRIGSAMENDHGKIIFHMQIDVESSGYLQSPLRNPGSEIEIMVSRSKKNP
jgi:hypothetical protein